MINVLNEDQTLIQMKRLEKLQHIESAQWCTNGRSITLTDGPFQLTSEDALSATMVG